MRAQRRRRIHKVVLTIVILAALAAAIGAPLVAKAASADEMGVLSMIASARSKAHLGRVGSLEGLEAVARRQSERMRDATRIFHNAHLVSDLNASNRGWTIAGENVGVGRSVQAVEAAFMASPEHRRNILNGAYNAVGVGVVRGTGGVVYVTQVFARLAASAPSRPAPSACNREVIAEDGSHVRASFYGNC